MIGKRTDPTTHVVFIQTILISWFMKQLVEKLQHMSSSFQNQTRHKHYNEAISLLKYCLWCGQAPTQSMGSNHWLNVIHKICSEIDLRLSVNFGQEEWFPPLGEELALTCTPKCNHYFKLLASTDCTV